MRNKEMTPTVEYWKPARDQQKRLVVVAVIIVAVVLVFILVVVVLVVVEVVLVLVVVLLVVLVKVCHIPCQVFEHGPSYSLSFVDFLE